MTDPLFFIPRNPQSAAASVHGLQAPLARASALLLRIASSQNLPLTCSPPATIEAGRPPSAAPPASAKHAGKPPRAPPRHPITAMAASLQKISFPQSHNRYLTSSSRLLALGLWASGSHLLRSGGGWEPGIQEKGQYRERSSTSLPVCQYLLDNYTISLL
jgi:hypothetical protein